jgi:hypothetical protein
MILLGAFRRASLKKVAMHSMPFSERKNSMHTALKGKYSGRNIIASVSYVTVRGEGKMERARGSKTSKSLSEHA